MKLKMSFYNKSIITSDIKRFWWVSALYTIILFFSLPMQHMLQVLPIKEEWQREALIGSLRLSSNGVHYYRYIRTDVQMLILYILPVFLAAMLFSYLHTSRAATMLHSLPLSRKTLFGSHVTSGILLFSAPVLITAVILAILASFTGLAQYYTIANVAEWVYLTLIFNLLFFSIAVFVGMLTGNVIAHVVFTYVINILPYGLYLLVGYNLEKLLCGFSSDILNSGWAKVLPAIKLIGFNSKEFTIVKGLLYLLTAIIFFCAAGLVYNRRKLEAAGNIIAFKVIRPVFKYGVVVCFMLSGGLITGYFDNTGTSAVITAYFVFAFIGYWISQALLDKTVRVWYAYKGFLILITAVILLLVGISADVTGYMKRIPAINEIENAYYGNNYYSWQQERNKLPEERLFPAEGFFKEEANIRSVMNLHNALTGSRNEDNWRKVYIAYELKNGRSMVRGYTIDEYAVRQFLEPIYESMEYKEGKYPVLSQNIQDIKWIEIGDRRTKKRPLILTDVVQIQGFFDILKNELIKSEFTHISDTRGESAYIRITDGNDRSETYDIQNSFKTLYSWLKENGHYESVMLMPEDISHVSVQALSAKWYGNGGYSYSTTGRSVELSDSALITELIDICSTRLTNDSSETYLNVYFYFQAGAIHPDFTRYISSRTPMSKELQQKLGELGRD